MRRSLTRRIPRRDGSSEASAAAEAQSGQDHGRADIEERRMGAEEAGHLRGGVGQAQECGKRGGEATQERWREELEPVMREVADMFFAMTGTWLTVWGCMMVVDW